MAIEKDRNGLADLGQTQSAHIPQLALCAAGRHRPDVLTLRCARNVKAVVGIWDEFNLGFESPQSRCQRHDLNN